MARLWKNGKEVLRVSKEKEFSDGNYSWKRVTRTVHENGAILEKYDSRLRENSKQYSGTWKKRGKVKAGVNIQAVKAHFDKHNWKIEKYSPAPSAPNSHYGRPAARGLFAA
jgi:hypothetical protein